MISLKKIFLGHFHELVIDIDGKDYPKHLVLSPNSPRRSQYKRKKDVIDELGLLISFGLESASNSSSAPHSLVLLCCKGSRIAATITTAVVGGHNRQAGP